MKKIFLILIVCSIRLFSQNDVLDFNLPITGIISSNESLFLIYNDGYIQLEQNDAYEEYYRKIYNDSTIVNPNTELREEFTLNVIPLILSSIKQNRIDFKEPLKLGFFIQANKSNSFNLTSYAKEIIDSLIEK